MKNQVFVPAIPGLLSPDSMEVYGRYCETLSAPNNSLAGNNFLSMARLFYSAVEAGIPSSVMQTHIGLATGGEHV